MRRASHRTGNQPRRRARARPVLLAGLSSLPFACPAHAQTAPAPVADTATPPAAPPRLNPTGRIVTLSAPLRDGDFQLSEVRFQLGADDSLSVERDSFVAALKPILSPERLAALETSAAGLPYIPAAQLEPLGLRVRYDPATIGVTIDIAPDARGTRDLAIARFEELANGQYLAPAGFSGYVNFRSFADYVWSGADKGFNTPSSLIDSAIRYKGVVLENEATVRFGNDSAGRSFTREGTRLVYDDRKRLVRWSAGDLIPIGRGFSGSTQIAGIGAVRQFSIVDPLRNVQPRGDRSFTLTRPSTVETLINGNTVRRVRLEPGTYNARDFPFVQGTNNVQFVIEDDAGGRQTIAFSQFFDRTLLAPGLTEFAAYAGVYAPFNGGSRDYQVGEPAASGWFRRGMSETLTLGANFNARDDGVTAGVETVLATPIGTFGADVAVSKVDGIGQGFAFNLGLQRSFGGYRTRSRSVSVSAEYRSRDFANPGALVVDNRFSWILSGAYSQAVGERQFVALSADYSIARNPLKNETSARLTYGYAINQRLNLSVDATYEDRNVFGREYGVRATLLVRLGRRSSAVAEVDTRLKRARLGYQTSRGEGVGSWTASADIEAGEDDAGFNGSFNYQANRAELGAAHTTVYEFNGNSQMSQRTSFRAGTSLVFADGKFALSRPIYDSFAMVAPHRSLKGAEVVIDPREGHYTAKSGTLGPAVDPNLAAYIRRTITYDVPKAPIGYDLGSGSARVVPPYRGGFLIVAGSDYSVTAVGTLTGPDGAPISLLAGTATELGGGGEAKKVTIFTNRSGRFGISGLRAGRWQIDMPTEPPTRAVIEIPDGELGVVRLGAVKLGE